MKLKDLKLDFPKEKITICDPNNPQAYQKWTARAYNQCREEFMNMEIEVDVEDLEHKFRCWVSDYKSKAMKCSKGRMSMARRDEIGDIIMNFIIAYGAQAIANSLPDILKGKSGQI